VANAHNLIVIEDAAQAIGAEDKGGVPVPSATTDASRSSLKNLGAVGDGGMIVTNDADRAEGWRFCAHGSKPKYHHRVIGGNFRLDAIQAAVVSAKLPYLDEWTAARRRNAKRYDDLFAAAGIGNTPGGSGDVSSRHRRQSPYLQPVRDPRLAATS
jgi:dTDP-4-amino-4,6-dideoxygalactose transaminase